MEVMERDTNCKKASWNDGVRTLPQTNENVQLKQSNNCPEFECYRR